MSMWGSLIGGMVGFSLGGPFGMLLGSIIGGKVSRAKSAGGFRSFRQPQQVFALSLIVLSAKLSKADGSVSREELVAVKDKLKIPENELDQVGKIFNQDHTTVLYSIQMKFNGKRYWGLDQTIWQEFDELTKS